MDRRETLGVIFACIAILLARSLCVVDQPEPSVYWTAPTYMPAVDHVERSPNVENDIDGTAAHLNVLVTNNEEATQLFGMETYPAGMQELRERWHHVVTMMTQDFAAIVQCRSNGRCPVAAQRLIDISIEGAGRSGRARIGLINRAANLAISPVSDERQWGAADHWSDPFETLLSYRGDCEDYAIVKYAALLQAGVATDDVRIVILKNIFPNEYHAVAAARVNGEWLILDNRTLTLVRDTDITRAVPVFVLDHRGVRRFHSPNRNRQAADRGLSTSG